MCFLGADHGGLILSSIGGKGSRSVPNTAMFLRKDWGQVCPTLRISGTESFRRSRFHTCRLFEGKAEKIGDGM
jgi:hypothetical protein